MWTLVPSKIHHQWSLQFSLIIWKLLLTTIWENSIHILKNEKFFITHKNQSNDSSFNLLYVNIFSYQDNRNNNLMSNFFIFYLIVFSYSFIACINNNRIILLHILNFAAILIIFVDKMPKCSSFPHWWHFHFFLYFVEYFFNLFLSDSSFASTIYLGFLISYACYPRFHMKVFVLKVC